MEDKIQQVIVVRADLKMRKGKIAAQSSHSSMAIFFKLMERYVDPVTREAAPNTFCLTMTDDMVAWKEGSFTKICVYVNSEEELMDVYGQAEAAGLPCALITDNGLTEFHGVKTRTCIAIGPAKKSDLDPITGHLPLY